MINNELLKILACPACRSNVELKEGAILCLACKNRYPIRNRIPIMLMEEAKNTGGKQCQK